MEELSCINGKLKDMEEKMSEYEPKEPYVYQPFGSVTHPHYAEVKRLWGVGGVSPLTDITGLTQKEANCIVEALIQLTKK